MSHNRGLFISLEGGEGAGKTTLIESIRAYLSQFHASICVTREPGGTPLGSALRGLLLDKQLPSMSAMSELLLMFADRAQHVKDVIEPALVRGEWVITDRFTDASFAYQGYGRGVDLKVIHTLETMVLNKLQPDLTLLLDMPIDTGQKRVEGRGEKDRIELESYSFFERVRQGYLERARHEPQRFVLIDASRDIHAVAHEARQALARLLESRDDT